MYSLAERLISLVRVKALRCDFLTFDSSHCRPDFTLSLSFPQRQNFKLIKKMLRVVALNCLFLADSASSLTVELGGDVFIEDLDAKWLWWLGFGTSECSQ